MTELKYYKQVLAITKNLNELRRIISWLDSYNFLDDDTKEYVKSKGSLTNTLFKKIEKCIVLHMSEIQKKTRPNSINTIIEVINYDQSCRNKIQETIINTIRNSIDLHLIKEDIKELNISTTKVIYTIRNEIRENGYLVFFYPILGKMHLPENSPNDCIKVQLIGEEVFANLLGKDKIVISHYPKLHEIVDATNNFRNQIIVQKHLKNYRSLDSIIDIKRTRKEGIKIYATAIADIQKSTFGICKLFINNIQQNRIVDILKQFKEYIYLTDPNSYYSWMINYSWVSNKIKGSTIYTNSIDNEKNALFTEFLKLAQRSKERLEVGGCLSQFDLLPRNILISSKNTFKYKFCDFEFVTFSDPAYDLGMALYSIIIQSIRNNYLNEVKELLETFLAIYIEDLKKHSNTFNETINICDFYSDAHKYAGFLLYGVTQSDYRNSYGRDIDFAKVLSFDYIYNDLKI